MTLYEKDGFRIDLVELEAVAIYIEGVFYCEMTLEEWAAVNIALTANLPPTN